MEEKKRYVWSQDFNQECPYEEFDYIVDSETDKVLDDFDIKDLLNQQDKKIKELEKENQELNDYLETDEVTKREYYQKVDKNDKAKDKAIKKLKDKIKELQDYTENTANLIDKLTEDSVSARTDLAIRVLEKLKENAFQSATDISGLLDYTELVKIIDNQIKELKGE